MLENATYSVITPEGCLRYCGRTLRKLRGRRGLCMTAQHLHAEVIVDKIISEPEGGAHNDYDQSARYLDSALSEHLRSG
jgi:acetyl-CoA carboxylase carboxyl transferase subunit alpha